MIPTISNIAWPLEEDAVAEAVLQELGVCSLELAPTRYWPNLAIVSETEARTCSANLHDRGFRVAAFQAVLFGQPALQVFGDNGGRDCQDYLIAVCRLAGWMGAGAVVLGSPKNRLRGHLSPSGAHTLAKDFFREVGAAAAAAGTRLCLEPNPLQYGGDFLLTAAEVADLVQAVDSPGIALNFDMGEQAMHGDDAASNILALAPLIGHFHVSEPMLAPFDRSRAAHTQAADALRAAHYTGAVSLEMKSPSGGLLKVRAALADMKAAYKL